MRVELPPTAGLPLRWSDFLSGLVSPQSFEEKLAEFLGCAEIDVYSSGTLCLSIAFEALKEISGRSRVIVPAYTCPLVAIAAHAAGVELVLCDIEANNCQLDRSMLAEICDSSIAAVVPTDIAGLPVDLSYVNEIAHASGARVVEDAAQALGAKRNGRSVGSEADIVIYSLAVGKGLSLYDGGVLRVNDPELREAARKIAARRIRKQPLMNCIRFAEMIGLTALYNPIGLQFAYGRNLKRCLDRHDLVRAVGEHFDLEIPAYEFDDFRKRIGISALERLPGFIAGNRKRALERIDGLRSISRIEVVSESSGGEGSWPFIMVLADTESLRDKIMGRLWRSGLGVTRLFIHELSDYGYLRHIIPQQSLQNAKSFAARSFTITNSSWLTDDDFAAVFNGIAKCDGVTALNSLPVH